MNKRELLWEASGRCSSGWGLQQLWQHCTIRSDKQGTLKGEPAEQKILPAFFLPQLE
jgi:hypothetical protein